MSDFPVYYGNSMYRVFVPGERLVLEDISFGDLLAGDVVTVKVPGKRLYVHRVIEKTADHAVTMGDNNNEPDEYIVTAQSDFQLVTAALTSDGTRRAVSRGSCGLRDFFRNRRQRKIHFLIHKVLIKCEKLFFWRRVVMEKKLFGCETCYYWKNRVIARRTGDGKVIYRSWLDRLKFRLPEETQDE